MLFDLKAKLWNISLLSPSVTVSIEIYLSLLSNTLYVPIRSKMHTQAVAPLGHWWSADRSITPFSSHLGLIRCLTLISKVSTQHPIWWYHFWILGMRFLEGSETIHNMLAFRFDFHCAWRQLILQKRRTTPSSSFLPKDWEIHDTFCVSQLA